MIYHLKNLLCTNIILKVSALCIGYCLWHAMSYSKTVSLWITVPLAFYGSLDHTITEAPENIDVLISGTRSDIYQLDTDNLCVHINKDHYSSGYYHVPITSELLFLPESIKLVHCYPLYVDIHIDTTPLNNLKKDYDG